MKLSTHMQAALHNAAHPDGIRRHHHPNLPGADPWPHPPASLHALERHGLITAGRLRHRKGHEMTVWRITDAGRAVLNQPAKVERDTVRTIHAGHGTTLRPVAGGEYWEEVRIPEPERMDAGTGAAFASDGQARHRALRGEKATKERLNRAGRAIRAEGIMAARSGVDVAASLERIERELDEMRRLREQHANDERKAA